MSSIFDSLKDQLRQINQSTSLTPKERLAREEAIRFAAGEKLKKAEAIVRQGANRAGNAVAARMRPISRNAAVAAKMLVDRGIPPGQAIKAAARVAEWNFLWGELDSFAADAASLSTAPIQLWGRRIQQEF